MISSTSWLYSAAVTTSLLVTSAVLAMAAPAMAATVVPLAHFDNVSLRGGGHIVLRNGPVQSVTLVKGSTQFTNLTVRPDGKLVIDACNYRCPHEYELEIEITSPDINGVSIDGGGKIETQGAFPGRDEFAAAVNGGGDIDVRAIAVRAAAAAVSGGGDIKIAAKVSLNAAVNGGGRITYWGDPSVRSAVNGGGSVSRAVD